MSEGLPLQNVRELLQYVPKFLGKTFVVELPWADFSDGRKAETMLDLAALHSVGVNLAVAVPEVKVKDILDWAIDFDLCLENDVQSSARGAIEVMKRGQVVVLSSDRGSYFSDQLVEIVCEMKPNKVISLVSCDLKNKLGKGVSISEDAWLEAEGKEWDFSASVSKMLCSGVNRIHLLDADQQSPILVELFSNEGCGMMIYSDRYRKIRKMTKEDIPEVLVMISRSVRNFILVPREYEDIELKLDDYYVYQIDENVVGCVALHRYEDGWAEVACLYVKQGHQQRGYGVQLVRYAEEQAKEQQIGKLFALTTNSADFFKVALGYEPLDLNSLPKCRLQQMEGSGRSSMAFYRETISKKLSQE